MAEILVASPFPSRGAASGDTEMKAHATKLQAAENDLKQLMVEVTRAMQKAEAAVARIVSETTAEIQACPTKISQKRMAA